MKFAWVVPPVIVVLAACGSVDVPEHHFYRLSACAIPGAAGAKDKIVRVEDFDLAPHLGGDNVLAVVGPNRVEPLRYHRWSAPLAKLVTEVVRESLDESGRYQAVVGLRDRVQADWAVSGRVLQFEQSIETRGWVGVVRLAVSVRDERSGDLIWRGCLSGRVAAKRSEPADGVRALDRALASALSRFPAIEAGDPAIGRPGR